MEKENFIQITEALRNNKIEFKLENYIANGLIEIKGIIFKSKEDVNKLKSLSNHDLGIDFKIRDTKLWYLDDEKDAVILKLKKKITLQIPEFEKLSITNYG